MPEAQSNSDPPSHRRSLPATITVGMSVVEIDAGLPGTIVGYTQAYCIYRISQTNALVVAEWRDVALGDMCPANQLLPANVAEIDRNNASAALLRELLALQQFGLTAKQTAALEELIATLCGETADA